VNWVGNFSPLGDQASRRQGSDSEMYPDKAEILSDGRFKATSYRSPVSATISSHLRVENCTVQDDVPLMAVPPLFGSNQRVVVNYLVPWPSPLSRVGMGILGILSARPS
jgi:hypothetical protein